jgi:hypothetical protein
MNLNSDGTVTVFGNQLTTRQVERLIHDLALARNLMEPQVPVDLMESENNVVLQSDADVAVSLNLEGDITFAARHRGFGWIVCAFSRDRAAQIGAALFRRGTGKDIDFITDGLPDGHRSH